MIELTYYLATHPEGFTALWKIDESNSTAHRVDGAQESLIVPQGIAALDAVKATRELWSFHEMELSPGEFYPRMARPNVHHPHESPGSNPLNAQNRELIETSRGQLIALRYQLESMLRVVHPVAPNFAAFGHEFRNVLIIAATEVEAQWKGVLKANGKNGKNTSNYVLLADALKLREFSIRLPFYPWLDPIRPFDSWYHSETPTKKLPWYDDYQAVKHDRENEFARATLLNALKAVCGCAVMLFAQFGRHGFHYREEINSFFEIASAPVWHPSECYFGVEGMPLASVHYPF